MKTSWRRLEDVFRLHLQKTPWNRLQDVLIKTNIFTLVIRLQKTSWSRPIYSSWPYVFKTFSRRLQDVLPRHLPCKNVFKTSSRRLQKRLPDIFKTACKDAFKMFWRRIIRLDCLSSSRIRLEHTSEKYKSASVIYFSITPWFQFFTILNLLVAAYRGLFRTLSNIYEVAFFCENT